MREAGARKVGRLGNQASRVCKHSSIGRLLVQKVYLHWVCRWACT